MHKTLLVIILLATLLISACTGSVNSERNPDFRFGSRALEMQVSHGSGQTVYDGEEMSILLELHNRGTSDINGGVLFVKGFSPQYLPTLASASAFTPSQIINLDGKSEYDPNGDLSYFVELNEPRVRAPTHKEILPVELQIVACYPYTTYGSYEVCVDPDPYNRRIDNKVCSYTETKAGAQGHPIAVTNIETQVGSTDMYFTLTINNVGDGIVFDPRLSAEACAYDLDRTNVDIVYLNNVALDGKPLFCEPTNPIRLVNGGSATVRCTCSNCVDVSAGAYNALLTTQIQYGYRNEVQTGITIVQN